MNKNKKQNRLAFSIAFGVTVFFAVLFMGGNSYAKLSIDYSRETLAQQGSVDHAHMNLEEKQLAEEQAKQVYLDARSATANARQLECKETSILGYMKLDDTPASFEAERERLHNSIQAADKCEMTAF